MTRTCPCGRVCEVNPASGISGAIWCCSPECSTAFHWLMGEDRPAAARLAAACGGYSGCTGSTGTTDGAFGPTGSTGRTGGGVGPSIPTDRLIELLQLAAPFRDDGIIQREIEYLRSLEIP